MSEYYLSFTGSRDLDERGRKIVGAALKRVKRSPRMVFSGGARGVDTLAANYAMQLWPEAKHIVFVPTFCTRFEGGKPVDQAVCNHDRAGVRKLQKLAAELCAKLSVQFAQPGIGKHAAGYLRRDDMLAQNCTHMMAFPRTGTEQRRSGTWATVRRGLAQNRRILITPLSGEEPYKL